MRLAVDQRDPARSRATVLWAEHAALVATIARHGPHLLAPCPVCGGVGSKDCWRCKGGGR